MTVDELRQIEADLLSRMEQVSGFLDIPGKEAELAALEEKMNSADFWDDKEKAQTTVAAASIPELSSIIPFAISHLRI